MFVFNKSVIGYSHIQRKSVCEDASASFASPDGRYYICAVADGHGDKRCFRSSFGSSAAVRAAVDKLKSFAELVLSEGNSKDGMLFKLINDPRYQRDSIKQLTPLIRYICTCTRTAMLSWDTHAWRLREISSITATTTRFPER